MALQVFNIKIEKSAKGNKRSRLSYPSRCEADVITGTESEIIRSGNYFWLLNFLCTSFTFHFL